jgi:diguanylate cyclase (GGDEF)-like protein
MLKRRYLLGLFIFICLLFAFQFTQLRQDYVNEEINSAVLNLNELTTFEDKLVRLDGEWEFFEKQFIDPYATSTNKELVKLPGKWDSYQDNKEEGYGSYRLNIWLTDNETTYALKFDDINSNYKVYWNGELVFEKGEVGKSFETSTPDFSRDYVVLNEIYQSNELVIHLSNYHQSNGGILSSVIFGDVEAINDLTEREVSMEMFYIGALLLIGSYHLVIWLLKKKELRSLIFSLLVFNFLVYYMFSNGHFPSFLSELDWVIKTRIEYFTLYITIGFIITLFYLLFRSYFIKLTYWGVLLIGLLFVVSTMLLPIKLLSQSILFFYIFMLLTFVYAVYVLFRAFKHEGKSKLLLFAFIVLSLTYINDLLVSLNLLLTNNLSMSGLLIFMFTVAVILLFDDYDQLYNLENEKQALSDRNNVLKDDLQLIEMENRALKDDYKKFEESKSKLTDKDVLTELYSHQKIYDLAHTVFENYNQKEMAIAVINLDNFKQVNDEHGHGVGDVLLQEFAKLLKLKVGDFNYVGRFSGDEFLILFRGFGINDAYEKTEHLRKHVEAATFTNHFIKITISVGLVEKTIESNVNELIHHADTLMTISKNEGKNKVTRPVL